MTNVESENLTLQTFCKGTQNDKPWRAVLSVTIFKKMVSNITVGENDPDLSFCNPKR